MPRESVLVTQIVKYLRAHGAFVEKIHGGPTQRAGLPDLTVIYQGKAIWLEVKVPGEKATPIQAQVLEEIRQAGDGPR